MLSGNNAAAKEVKMTKISKLPANTKDSGRVKVGGGYVRF